MSEIRVTGADVAVARLDGLERMAAAFGRQRVVVGTNVQYARAVHFGSRPHIIRPVRKKMLFWKGAAHPVRVVHHPGTKPHPFLADGLRAALPTVKRKVAEALASPTGASSALMAAGLAVQAEAQKLAPVKTGNLRRSIHTEAM
jgi:hypothetical protein